jgi:hypothetical protein
MRHSLLRPPPGRPRLSLSAWRGGQPEDSDARPGPRLRREAGDVGQMAVHLVDQTWSARYDRHRTLRGHFGDNPP